MAPPSKKRRISPPPFPLPSSTVHSAAGYVESPSVSEWVDGFWQHSLEQIESLPLTGEEYKNPSLPLARIKKVMKTDEEVRMIAQEVPILLAKACELFIYELTGRAYIVADASKRRTITKEDILRATEKDADHLDFLVDIMHRVRPYTATSTSFPPAPSTSAFPSSPPLPGTSTAASINHSTTSPTSPVVESSGGALSKEVFNIVGRAIVERKGKEREEREREREGGEGEDESDGILGIFTREVEEEYD
ncbi:hypothetical protein BT69DRAFT_1267731 [Atractiella rhizophila]|nr:hypothetical protein BT69DRAFT_1267731 [Atractiella rhizophila]